jgi:hypothetical protein
LRLKKLNRQVRKGGASDAKNKLIEEILCINYRKPLANFARFLAAFAFKKKIEEALILLQVVDLRVLFK